MKERLKSPVLLLAVAALIYSQGGDKTLITGLIILLIFMIK